MERVKPLSGVRILDLTHMIAGPYATLLLAYFGAEVIKVESKYRLDGFRLREGDDWDASRPYCDFNRNKLGITLNLKTEEGLELIKELVKVSDVIVENFSAGVMDKLGLGFQSLKLIKEDIIMVSLQGLGKTGSKKDFVTWGPSILSISGMTYLWNHPETAEPVGSQTAYADYIAASHGALAILAALYYKRRTGKGQFIDVSQVESAMYMLGPVLLAFLKNSNAVEPQGNSNPSFAPSGCYRCKGEDRWLALEIQTEEEWQNLCKAFARQEWETDPRFSDMLLRVKHRKVLDSLIEQETFNRTAEETVELLQISGISAGYVMNGEDLVKDKHLNQRDFVVPVPHPKMDLAQYPGIPIRLSRTPGSIDRHAPLLGQDNYYVFHELLGLSDEDIDDFSKRDVIC